MECIIIIAPGDEKILENFLSGAGIAGDFEYKSRPGGIINADKAIAAIFDSAGITDSKMEDFFGPRGIGRVRQLRDEALTSAGQAQVYGAMIKPLEGIA